MKACASPPLEVDWSNVRGAPVQIRAGKSGWAMNILPKATASARRRSIVVAPVLVCTPPLCRQNGHGRPAGEISTEGLRSVPGTRLLHERQGSFSLKCAVIGMLRFYRAMDIP